MSMFLFLSTYWVIYLRIPVSFICDTEFPPNLSSHCQGNSPAILTP